MKQLIAAAALAAAFATPAFAAGIDMAALTCKDLTTMDQDSAGVVVFWLDGYVSHKTGDTKVDFDQLKQNGTALGSYCGANPDAKVLEYVESQTGGH